MTGRCDVHDGGDGGGQNEDELSWELRDDGDLGVPRERCRHALPAGGLEPDRSSGPDW
ncbi:hypothetical protein BH11ACT8_BH11ACT8_13160 [soil metagenome]